MRTIAQLQKARDDLKSFAAKAARTRDELNQKIQALTARQEFNSDYVASETARHRETAVKEASTPTRHAVELAAVVKNGLQFWQSTPYVVSQQKFDSDPDRDHTARTHLQERLRYSSAQQLQMEFARAKADNNLAETYTIWSIHQRRQADTGYLPLTLSGLDLPVQRQALALISEALAIKSVCEAVFVEVIGRRQQDPLAVARASTPQIIEPSLNFENVETRFEPPVEANG